MRNTNTKAAVVRYLEENTGRPVSGGKIAEDLGISRTAVWKAIKILEADGYQIDAVTGRGYTLRRENDVVSAAGILKYLTDETGAPSDIHPLAARWHVFEEVTSTNDLLKEEAVKGAPEGTAFVATSQTRGKGRRGRSFWSPEGTGIYFSFLLRPGEEDPAAPAAPSVDPGRITTMAAVAVAEAIERCGVGEVGIKWVNDVYVRDRKVCGILAEATTDLETGDVVDVVVGIGLNIYTPEGGFPADIANRAGSILDCTPGEAARREDAAHSPAHVEDARNKLVAYTYESFFDLYRRAAYHEVADRYRAKCFVPGRRITVVKAGEEKEALAVSLDDHCHLLVRYDDGSEEELFSGEISIKI